MKLSDGEKLILMMLSEIHKHLNIDEESAKFIESAIMGGHLWAIKERFVGIYPGEQDDPENVREVRNILGMWSNLEYSYSICSQEEQTKVEAEAQPFGVMFGGFDGNYEAEYMGIANFLVNQMGRFEKFKGRDINSHCPCLESYKRMYAVYEPMLARGLPGGKLGVSQMIEVVKARR